MKHKFQFLSIIIIVILTLLLYVYDFAFQQKAPNENRCDTADDCPQIRCIRAPCSFNVCENGVCVMINPEN